MTVAWEGMEEAVAIAEAGSFVGAAQMLRVSSSHVSKAIARLEERLEIQLFHRTTRRVELTDTGRAFVEQCRRMIEERDELLLQMSGSGEPHGTLRLTCSIALGERYVAPLVRDFLNAHPRVSVSIDLTNRIVDLVGEGYDVGIRTGEPGDARLSSRQIASRSIEVCATPDYLAAAGVPETVDDLSHHQCLVGTSGSWHFLEKGVLRTYTPQGRWRCNNGSAVVEAALAGMGICQLPAYYLQDHIASGRLRPVLERYRCAPEPIWIVCPRRRQIVPKIRSFVDFLERAIRDEVRIS